MTSGLEMEWDYSGRKGRDGQKKKIGKANERKRKVTGGKDKEINGQGRKRGAPAPHKHNTTDCWLVGVMLAGGGNLYLFQYSVYHFQLLFNQP